MQLDDNESLKNEVNNLNFILNLNTQYYLDTKN